MLRRRRTRQATQQGASAVYPNRIAEWLAVRGKTVPELAELARLPYKTLDHYVAWRRKVPPEAQSQIARALELRESDLVAITADPAELERERQLIEDFRRLDAEDQAMALRVIQGMKKTAA